MMNTKELEHKVAVVTGGAMGIGRAVCEAYAEAGARVILVDTAEQEAWETADNLRSEGCEVHVEIQDVRDIDAMDALFRKYADLYGHIDLLVTSAGVIYRLPAEKVDEEKYDHTMDVNVKAMFFCCQLAARQMIRQKTGGVIINIASTASFGVEGPTQTAYGMSKLSARYMTECLAAEWADKGIRVNAIAPGYIRTPFNIPFHTEHPDILKNLLGIIPQGTPGYAEDLKGTALFLASEASRRITGATIVVDGGMLCNFPLRNLP